jgi:hypothetical protein
MSRRVDVSQDGRFWLVEVAGVGVTQARRLSEVEAMAADLCDVMDADSQDLDIHVQVPDEALRHWAAAGKLHGEAARIRSDAAREASEAARSLQRAGLTLRDIGAVLGVSYQRAAQLVH